MTRSQRDLVRSVAPPLLALAIVAVISRPVDPAPDPAPPAPVSAAWAWGSMQR
jgi:hypothetical protein